MGDLSRRRILGGTVAALGAAVAGTELLASPARADSGAALAEGYAAGPFGPATVRPADPRYPTLTVGHNRRWTANPDYVRLVGSTAQVVQAVQEAVSSGRRLSVVSGGHCFADFVFNQDVKVVIDVSGLNRICYDPRRRAFEVGAGATLLNVYETLFKGWGVALPGGMCYSVGVAGHTLGGGYGFLSREHGIVADHLEAVEVVVVDQNGVARAVVAGRDPGDPNHDLWWGHAGAGGGNFGIVTRFWFRSPGATGDEPSQQLMSPPNEVLVHAMALPWNQVDQAQFTRLVSNYGTWHENHRAADDPYAALCGFVLLNHVSNGAIALLTQIDATSPNAEQLLDDYLAAVLDGVTAQPKALTVPSGEYGALPHLYAPSRMSWLTSVKLLGTNNPSLANPTLRSALKSAYFKRGYTPDQIAVLYRHLNSTDIQNPNAVVSLVGFAGGAINTVAPDATAAAHRDAAFLTLFQTLWSSPDADAAQLGWLRGLYGELFAATGGYPVPDANTDGCYINTPDPDILDPRFNQSGVPWSTLYYKDNYPRLQQVKATYDPLNIFHHSQSVAPADR